MKYDFVLFENFYWATNHYKDLAFIARLLKSGGYTVAIADVFRESMFCNVEGVPHIRIRARLKINLKPSDNRIKILGDAMNIIKRFVINHYLKKVVNEIKNSADSFYVGSYHSGISLGWLRQFPDETNVIFWGLRSYRLYEYKVRPFSKVAINSFRLRKYIDGHDNIRFFVSDELIKQEFIKIGIDEKR